MTVEPRRGVRVKANVLVCPNRVAAFRVAHMGLAHLIHELLDLRERGEYGGQHDGVNSRKTVIRKTRSY